MTKLCHIQERIYHHFTVKLKFISSSTVLPSLSTAYCV